MFLSYSLANLVADWITGVHRRSISGLLPCISYGGMEKTEEDGEIQELFRAARSGSNNTAAAIAAGARGRNLGPPMALDFGAWMVTRPDLYVPLPLKSAVVLSLILNQLAMAYYISGFHPIPAPNRSGDTYCF
jgi:hypothetical protein